MAERKPHIGIELPDNAPDIFIDKILADLYVDGLELKVRKRPEIGPMNALEWIIPTAIAAYIFKSYFDGFAGRACNRRMNTFCASRTPGSCSNRPSPAL